MSRFVTESFSFVVAVLLYFALIVLNALSPLSCLREEIWLSNPHSLHMFKDAA